MAYKQNPLKYSKYSDMPGLEFANEDVAMKERLATNALGVTPPADLFDGEFFLKDNDPQDFYRTLYIKRGEDLDKVVTFTDTGKALYDGVNEINLDDDEEVKGVLPKRKIITATATVQMDNIQNIVAFDGNKFQEVAKADFVAEKAKLADNATNSTNSVNAELSELSKDIKYNIIDNDSPITDVKDLPFGWSIIFKVLNNEPQNIRIQNSIPFIYKYKREFPLIPELSKTDLFIVFRSNSVLYNKLTPTAIGSYNLDTQLFDWGYDNKFLDLSISTEVSKTGTFSASQTVLMVENDVIKKVPKGEIIASLPVGFIYIQLRGQSTPDQLFGSSGKWQDISSTYAGEFFRAVGGNSAAFGSKQAEGLPNIYGMVWFGQSLIMPEHVSGAFSSINSYSNVAASTLATLHNALVFDASKFNKIYGASTHVTPYNSSVRIWKKIS